MPDSKHLKWTEEYGTEAETPEKATDTTLSSDQPAANDADGWQQYRRWVSKAPTPQARRSGIDPALYTWKGYRNWTEQVRRNWDPEHDIDNNED